MAIDFPQEFSVSRCEWYLLSNTQEHKSPLSGAVQTIELPGAKWAAKVIIENQFPCEARAIASFLVSLRGQAGGFYLFDHAHPDPTGTALGAPLVNGAGQTGTTLSTSGWTINQSGLLLAGDYIQVGAEFKMVVADANSDSEGNAVIDIEPPWRNSPADLADVIVDRPKALMRLTTDKTGIKSRAPWVSETVISCIEDIST